LEQKIIQHLSKSREYRMINKKEGTMINLPRMVQDEMDTFFDNMQIILPTLGYSLLHIDNKIPVNAKKSQMDTLYLEIGGYKALAKLTSNGLEVQKGSQMKLEETPSISGS